MTITLESLGFTKEELQDRVVEQIANQVMAGVSLDEDGNEYQRESSFSNKLRDAVRKRIDATISDLAEKHVLPNVATYIENLTMQATNQWGEKTKKPLTFIEYLTERAEAYLNEQVNYEGKSKSQDSYSWSGVQTRITYLVNSHLHHSIKQAMEAAVKNANSLIAKGIEETVKIKLAEITNALKVEVKTKN